jgi:NhaA family Na+:H+ antiporter
MIALRISMSIGNHNQRGGGVFERFFRSETSGSIVLLACTVGAMAWANSRWAGSYHDLAHTAVGVSWGARTFTMSVGHWIADGLMAVFFFVVGLEIKRELVVGQLSSFKKAALPVSAAFGGMLVPAIIYLILNGGTPQARGWGVPVATDIAFAVGILALFGRRVPVGLKVFLTALAIADDLGAVLVIALFYTEQVAWAGLLAAVVFLALIAAASRAGVRRAAAYIVLAIGVWIGVLASGVHATVAGVLVAMLVPVRAAIDPTEFLARGRRRLDELQEAGLTRASMLQDHQQLDALQDLFVAAADMRPAGITLEHSLHPLQSFLILPLFALFKAGIPVDAQSLNDLANPVTLGVAAGLVLGKPLGVTLFSWLPIRLGWAELPAQVTWAQLGGVSCLAGVGFTMSIFISELAFADPAMNDLAKLGVLGGSLISGLAGLVILAWAFPRTSPAGLAGSQAPAPGR